MYPFEVVLATLLVLLGLLGLWFRPLLLSCVLFLVAGLGVVLLVDLLVLGVPTDLDETLLGPSFFLLWVPALVALQYLLRRTASGRELELRVLRFLERIASYLPLSWQQNDPGVVENRQFNASLEAAAKWAARRKRLDEMLAAAEDRPDDPPPPEPPHR